MFLRFVALFGSEPKQSLYTIFDICPKVSPLSSRLQYVQGTGYLEIRILDFAICICPAFNILLQPCLLQTVESRALTSSRSSVVFQRTCEVVPHSFYCITPEVTVVSLWG